MSLCLEFESLLDLIFFSLYEIIKFPGKIEVSDFCLSADVLSA